MTESASDAWLVPATDIRVPEIAISASAVSIFNSLPVTDVGTQSCPSLMTSASNFVSSVPPISITTSSANYISQHLSDAESMTNFLDSLMFTATVKRKRVFKETSDNFDVVSSATKRLKNLDRLCGVGPACDSRNIEKVMDVWDCIPAGSQLPCQVDGTSDELDEAAEQQKSSSVSHDMRLNPNAEQNMNVSGGGLPFFGSPSNVHQSKRDSTMTGFGGGVNNTYAPPGPSSSMFHYRQNAPVIREGGGGGGGGGLFSPLDQNLHRYSQHVFLPPPYRNPPEQHQMFPGIVRWNMLEQRNNSIPPAPWDPPHHSSSHNFQQFPPISAGYLPWFSYQQQQQQQHPHQMLGGNNFPGPIVSLAPNINRSLHHLSSMSTNAGQVDYNSPSDDNFSRPLSCQSARIPIGNFAAEKVTAARQPSTESSAVNQLQALSAALQMQAPPDPPASSTCISKVQLHSLSVSEMQEKSVPVLKERPAFFSEKNVNVDNTVPSSVKPLHGTTFGISNLHLSQTEVAPVAPTSSQSSIPIVSTSSTRSHLGGISSASVSAMSHVGGASENQFPSYSNFPPSSYQTWNQQPPAGGSWNVPSGMSNFSRPSHQSPGLQETAHRSFWQPQSPSFPVGGGAGYFSPRFTSVVPVSNSLVLSDLLQQHTLKQQQQKQQPFGSCLQTGSMLDYFPTPASHSIQPTVQSPHEINSLVTSSAAQKSSDEMTTTKRIMSSMMTTTTTEKNIKNETGSNRSLVAGTTEPGLERKSSYSRKTNRPANEVSMSSSHDASCRVTVAGSSTPTSFAVDYDAKRHSHPVQAFVRGSAVTVVTTNADLTATVTTGQANTSSILGVGTDVHKKMETSNVETISSSTSFSTNTENDSKAFVVCNQSLQQQQHVAVLPPGVCTSPRIFLPPAVNSFSAMPQIYRYSFPPPVSDIGKPFPHFTPNVSSVYQHHNDGGAMTDADPEMYEAWLVQHDRWLIDSIQNLEQLVAQQRRTKKSLSAKQRTAKKSGRDLSEFDVQRLSEACDEQTRLQQQLYQLRKDSRNHQSLFQDFHIKSMGNRIDIHPLSDENQDTFLNQADRLRIVQSIADNDLNQQTTTTTSSSSGLISPSNRSQTSHVEPSEDAESVTEKFPSRSASACGVAQMKKAADKLEMRSMSGFIPTGKSTPVEENISDDKELDETERRTTNRTLNVRSDVNTQIVASGFVSRPQTENLYQRNSTEERSLEPQMSSLPTYRPSTSPVKILKDAYDHPFHHHPPLPPHLSQMQKLEPFGTYEHQQHQQQQPRFMRSCSPQRSDDRLLALRGSGSSSDQIFPWNCHGGYEPLRYHLSRFPPPPTAQDHHHHLVQREKLNDMPLPSDTEKGSESLMLNRRADEEQMKLMTLDEVKLLSKMTESLPSSQSNNRMTPWSGIVQFPGPELKNPAFYPEIPSLARTEQSSEVVEKVPKKRPRRATIESLSQKKEEFNSINSFRPLDYDAELEKLFKKLKKVGLMGLMEPATQPYDESPAQTFKGPVTGDYGQLILKQSLPKELAPTLINQNKIEPILKDSGSLSSTSLDIPMEMEKKRFPNDKLCSSIISSFSSYQSHLNNQVSVTVTLEPSASRDIASVVSAIANMLKVAAPLAFEIDTLPPRYAEEALEIKSLIRLRPKFCRSCAALISSSRKKEGILFKNENVISEEDDYGFCSIQCRVEHEGACQRSNVSKHASSSSLCIVKAEHDVGNVIKKMSDTTIVASRGGKLMRMNEDHFMKRILVKESQMKFKRENQMKLRRWAGIRYKRWSMNLMKNKNKQKRMEEDDANQMVEDRCSGGVIAHEVIDQRMCLFCHMTGDGLTDGPGRLLNMELDRWVHINCALWSSEVYETMDGTLMNVSVAYERGRPLDCVRCYEKGATIGCFKTRCTNCYHLECARKDGVIFLEDKTVFCPLHVPKFYVSPILQSLSVFRKVSIDRDEQKQIAEVLRDDDNIENCRIRVGGLILYNIGQLLPQQIQSGKFNTNEHVYPVGYKSSRCYWSFRCLRRRCRYVCSINDVDDEPCFTIKVKEPGQENIVIMDSTCNGVWLKILEPLEQLRRKENLTSIFTDYIRGEDLYGLTEPAVQRVIESLPGLELLTKTFKFRFGKSSMYVFPPTINPTGCVRSEPKMKTLFKRSHTLLSSIKCYSSNSESAWLGSGEFNITQYMKQFAHTKPQRYRYLKTEWRNNVYLRRSNIQGLGLFASRELEQYTMVIEYIGQLIRSELCEIREKIYDQQNRGIYMFRVDENTVVDATMSGGPARYINHSCDPNCFTEIVQTDRGNKIVITALRKINSGEELTYDYKFDFDDEKKIPCLCGAAKCHKWMN